MTTDSMITMQEAAAALDGNEYGFEGSRDLFARMKAAGLVAVFGYGDDLMEFRGAVYDEIGAYHGGMACFTKAGMVDMDSLDGDQIRAATSVSGIWGLPEIEAPWLIETNLPYVHFNITEDGSLFCIGLVFDLKDCAPPPSA